MSHQNSCNCRAGSFLIVLLGVLTGGAMPAFGQSHWFDPAGVTEDDFGNSMTVVPDLNGDGFDEFLLGVAGSDTTGLDAGEAFLWFGGTHVLLAPDRIWTGTSPELFGWAVADIGDVNNDGIGDFAIGAPLSNAGGAASGRVCVFYGGPNPSATPDVVISGASGGDQFGYAISAAGDFNGDNRDDFIVGAPYSDLNGLAAGAAYIIYGSSSGPSSNLADATVFAGEVAGDHFGWAVADAGNFLGGTSDCVAVGAPLANTHGGLDAGAVYVFQGSASPDTTIDWVAGIGAASKAGSQFGFCVRNGGNLDGDSYDDLVVGAPYSNEAGSDAGRVEFFYGDPSPAVVPDHYVNGQSSGGRFGWAIDRLGDLAGTSREDVLIGAPYLSLDATSAGRAYVYEGGSGATNAGNLTVILDQPVMPGTTANDRFGWAVSSAGDFDGDGLPDFAIAAPGGNIGSSNAPAGFVFLEHSTDNAWPVPALLRDWKAAWRDADVVRLEFSLSLAPERVVAVQLERRTRGSDGAVRGGELVWNGAPVAGDDGAVGTLFRTVDHFVFRDVPTAAGEPLYSLTATTDDGQVLRLDALAGPGLRPVTAPVGLALQPAWPNPANPAVSIRFRAPQGETATVRIVDVRGHVVRNLHRAAGTGAWQELIWRGDTDSGRAAPSGVYLIRVATGHELQTSRVVLAR